jgi:uncharacterized ubiquitin-like protein YukD
MKKFIEFISENQDVFSKDAAEKWFRTIKKDPLLLPYIGASVMNDKDYNTFKKVIDHVLSKYKDNLYPKELEYVKEMLLDLVFEISDDDK